jgi:ABC-2 type transporter
VLGRRMYLAAIPPKIALTTNIPRVLLQCVFFTLIGRGIRGEAGERYAFIGCVAFAAMTSTIVAVCDVPMEDKWCDTHYRIQRGVLPPALLYLCRVVPYLVEGMVMSVLVLVVLGPVLGLAGLSLRLLPLLPLYGLVAATTIMFGLAVAGLAVGRDADVLLGNLAIFGVLGTASVVAPLPSSARWLAIVGNLLPGRHGLQAIRAALAGLPWTTSALVELATGLGWLAVGLTVLTVMNVRARAR